MPSPLSPRHPRPCGRSIHSSRRHWRHSGSACPEHGPCGGLQPSPSEGGVFYVIEKDRPAGAPGLRLDLPRQSSFDPKAGLTITGTSTAKRVQFAAVIPGAVIDQGTLEVKDGKFSCRLDPAAINRATPIYDITNLKTGAPEIKDVIHLSFFSREVTPEGMVCHSFVRLIVRGTTVLYAT